MDIKLILIGAAILIGALVISIFAERLQNRSGKDTQSQEKKKEDK